MGQVTVILNGRTYRLRCGDGEEQRLHDLAEHVRQRIDDLSYEFGQGGDERLLVMATLMITDELWDLKAQFAELQAKSPASQASEADAAEATAPVRRSRNPAPTAEPADIAFPVEVVAPVITPAAAVAAPVPAPVPAPMVQEPSLKRALRRPQARASLDERLAGARDPAAPDRKSGTS